ncbi:hypothetical protein ACWGB8_01780 [Kitasatospora sp. NPDC054939]
MGLALHTDPYADQAVARLHALWDNTHRHRFETPAARIAGSPEDQRTPEGRPNPLWEIVRLMPAETSWRYGTLEPELSTWSINRQRALDDDPRRGDLSSRYAWSIITPGDVDWIVEQLAGRSVVEIGAGTGYWAWQLQQAGVDVAAYDPNPPAAGNEYCKHGPYADVQQGGAEAVRAHQDRALLMVWPPYGGQHAEETLRAYDGGLLIYAGEGYGGCTADDGFYELLHAEWDEVSVAPRHVSWSGINCSLSAWRRKEG